jgi:tRNA pseudouridine13 synthase
VPDSEALKERLQIIATAGVPNYFGEQRFGRAGANIALADAWSGGKRLPRHKRSIAISTARSFLFNKVLDVRVREKSWNQLVPGDVANLDGSGSVFSVDEPDDDLKRRCDELDVHPTGLLWGEGAPISEMFSDHEKWLAALTKARVKPANRSLRLRITDFNWSMVDGSLELEFSLGRGAYATAVLREIAVLQNNAIVEKKLS